MINVISSSRYKLDRKNIRRVTQSYLEEKNIQADKIVNVVFVGRNKMKEISKTYKQEDVALPVLSFLYNDQASADLYGEIIICYPQAVMLAAERDKKVQDIIEFERSVFSDFADVLAHAAQVGTSAHACVAVSLPSTSRRVSAAKDAGVSAPCSTTLC